MTSGEVAIRREDAHRQEVMRAIRSRPGGITLDELRNWVRQSNYRNINVESVVKSLVLLGSADEVRDGNVVRYLARISAVEFGGSCNVQVGDTLPLHFQTRTTRQAFCTCIAAAQNAKTRFPTDGIYVNSKGAFSSSTIQSATFPLTVTVWDEPSTRGLAIDNERAVSWVEGLAKSRVDVELIVRSRNIQDSDLEQALSPNAKTRTAVLEIHNDQDLSRVAALVQKPLCVTELTLRVSRNAVQALTGSAVRGLFAALRLTPADSQLERFALPHALGHFVLGHPEALATSKAHTTLKEDPRASAIVVWGRDDDSNNDEFVVPAAPIEEEPAEDDLHLWLTHHTHGDFDAARAVRFPREALLHLSPVIREMLEDNPEEYKIPLPMLSLKGRSVSDDALHIFAGLVRTLGTALSDASDADAEELSQKRPRKEAHLFQSGVAWTPAFRSVYESSILPLMVDIDDKNKNFVSRYQLSVFGEILELGQFLQMPAASEFGLVGAVGVVLGML